MLLPHQPQPMSAVRYFFAGDSAPKIGKVVNAALASAEVLINCRRFRIMSRPSCSKCFQIFDQFLLLLVGKVSAVLVPAVRAAGAAGVQQIRTFVGIAHRAGVVESRATMPALRARFGRRE